MVTNILVQLGQDTFTSLSAFESAMGSQPDIPFEILNTVYSCSTVSSPRVQCLVDSVANRSMEVTVRWVSKMTPQQVCRARPPDSLASMDAYSLLGPGYLVVGSRQAEWEMADQRGENHEVRGYSRGIPADLSCDLFRSIASSTP